MARTKDPNEKKVLFRLYVTNNEMEYICKLNGFDSPSNYLQFIEKNIKNSYIIHQAQALNTKEK